MNLFTYGTLMFPEVWHRIDVGDFPSEPATLPGFAIYRVKDAVFPGMVRAEPDSHVEGIVYRDLTDDALFELDAYESDFYDRIPVIAAGQHGLIDCTAYVVPNSHRSALTNQPWSREWFAEHQLERYLNG